MTKSSLIPHWTTLIVWIAVNIVNVLQGIGFLSRIPNAKMTLNHILGYIMIALSVPVLAALVAFIRTRSEKLHWIGPIAYLVFIVLMVVVDYAWPVEFRSPARYEILVPYLVLFFGSILLMGLPMFRLNRRLWLVTVATTIFLLISMVLAMRKGVA